VTRSRLALIACSLIAVVTWPVAGGLGRAYSPGRPGPADTNDLPAQFSDAEFLRLSQTFSEAGGTFHSDNFISNEGHFQDVIPELVNRVKADGVYLGVGPEQNFTYIAAVRPRLAFIVDIRRGNLHEHLLYKALFELSPTRADFLGRLFSRKRPEGLSSTTPVDVLFAAYRPVQASQELYRQNFKAVIDQLNGVHRLGLTQEDIDGIEYVYRSAFYREGPELGYALTGSARMGQVPSYVDLMTMTDAGGKRWSYLSSEERYGFVKSLETRNLIVPVVGDFGGPKALRSVGAYVRRLNQNVNTFYLSNVEQYLRQDGIWNAFCGNVASMPLDTASTFIRSTGSGGPGAGGRSRGAAGAPRFSPGSLSFTSSLGGMMSETRNCMAGRP
jgi:hypothetical protein